VALSPPPPPPPAPCVKLETDERAMTVVVVVDGGNGVDDRIDGDDRMDADEVTELTDPCLERGGNSDSAALPAGVVVAPISRLPQ
jgi:hypothetical protein